MSSPTKPTIEDLPILPIEIIFKHLHLKDLDACSRVNKRWRSIYADFKVNSLVAKGVSFYYHPQETKWSYPDRKFEEKELCRPEELDRLADKPLLSKLQYLALCGESPAFDLDQLNRFEQLVHLEINIEDLGSTKVSLKLPNLSVLACNRFNCRSPLSIDCPLNVLVYIGEPEDANLLDVKHPETIRKLETNMTGPKLARFTNVEYLATEEFQVICKATLQSLPRLNELRYQICINSCLRGEVDTIDRMKQALREFMGQVKRLRKDEFKFRFAGFQLNETVLDEIDFGVQVRKGRERVSDSYVYMKNYQLIDPDAADCIYRLR